jgi:hypothetical protein
MLGLSLGILTETITIIYHQHLYHHYHLLLLTYSTFCCANSCCLAWCCTLFLLQRHMCGISNVSSLLQVAQGGAALHVRGRHGQVALQLCIYFAQQ